MQNSITEQYMKSFYSFLFISIFLFSAVLISAQDSGEKYSKVKIRFQNYEQITQLASQGLILDHPFYERAQDGFSLTAVINQDEKIILSSAMLKHEVLIADVIDDYNKREKLSLSKLDQIQKINQIDGFEFGSMGGYYTFDEVLSELDSMKSLYPDIITVKDSIGSSNEARGIWAVKISDNPNVDEDEPELLYTSLHHAREPESMMTVIYFMYYLLENYGSDAEVTYLVDNREFHFIPVINPDGYVYNSETNPNGGGMWRKNRKENEDGSFGVDLNRNYGYNWGFNDFGSSPDPTSSTFRGESAFSEPETQTVRDYCEKHNFALALNYHTYSNLLIYPWGYETKLTPDSSVFIQYASEMTKYNNYTFGTGEETVGYLTNGDADDWMYGEQTTKNKILAMTPEVGNGNDGFWPLQSRIYPLAEENIFPNLLLAQFAGGFVSTISYNITESEYNNGYLDPGEEGTLNLSFKNIGQGEAGNIGFTIVNSDSFITFVNPVEIQIPTLLSQEEKELNEIKFIVSSSTPIGYSTNILYRIMQNGIEKEDTIKNVMFGTPKILEFENGNDIANLKMDGAWDTTSSSFNSEKYSFTDSPNSEYRSNIDYSMTIKKAIDLSADSLIYLEYWTKWHIEKDWDFAQVYVSTDSTNWEPLRGHLMTKGSGEGVQPSAQYGYHGLQSKWIKESIDISNYSGSPKCFIRFNIKSDEYIEFDGWYIDDIVVKSYREDVTNVQQISFVPNEYQLQQNYPNPFNPTTRIKYQLPKDGFVNLRIYDVLGREVKNLVNEVKKAGTYEIKFDMTEHSSGIYFYKIQVNDFAETKKMIVLK
jgi:carboxypeptidase T